MTHLNSLLFPQCSQWLSGSNSAPREISLYFHVPFCTHKCAYCHFYVIPDKEPLKEKYLEAIQLEWLLWKEMLIKNNCFVGSIYFGGGTPSLLGPTAIATIIKWVTSSLPLKDGIEITLEANPENISLQLMKDYCSGGINRVSIGVQTLDSTLLQTLDRRHSAENAIQAVELTFDAGITNISIDLMYDLPGQTIGQWKNTLVKAKTLPISHLSLYNLTIEPHTAFFKNQELLRKTIPDPETSLEMYQLAVSLLEESGLKQYEISAFARGNKMSYHNLGYWTARPFIGLGPSAFSYWEGKRFRNVAHLNRYHDALKAHNSPIDFEEELSPENKTKELLAINLRLKSGVNLSQFQQMHGLLAKETLIGIEKLKEEDLIVKEGDVISLTSKGILFYDSVAVELI